jgi:hypothetical protein
VRRSASSLRVGRPRAKAGSIRRTYEKGI